MFSNIFMVANQRYFKELTNVDVRGQMFTGQQNAIEADMAFLVLLIMD